MVLRWGEIGWIASCFDGIAIVDWVGGKIRIHYCIILGYAGRPILLILLNDHLTISNGVELNEQIDGFSESDAFSNETV